MTQICTNPHGICTSNCSKRSICTIPRRSLIQHFVATKANRGVYTDSRQSEAIETLSEYIVPFAGTYDACSIGKTKGVKIHKGMVA